MEDFNHHSAHIIGKNFSVFIDGIPDQCDHDDNGPELLFNEEGQYFKTSEVPDFKTDPDACDRFWKENKINGGCVSCSKCGKPFTPPMW